MTPGRRFSDGIVGGVGELDEDAGKRASRKTLGRSDRPSTWTQGEAEMA